MTLQEQLQIFAQKKLAAEKAKGKAFQDANKARKEVIVLPNGLQYEVLASGPKDGRKPNPADTVTVDYAGTLIDGTEFDNSYKRGKPSSFALNGVIRGWTELLQLMVPGDKWRVVIPSDLAYGDRGKQGAIPPGATLVFDIALINVQPTAQQ
jgi:FKBP-type peptidyl-prolyl cis-trans isomerase